MAQLSLPRGTDRDFLLQARDGQGAAFEPVLNPSPFDGSEALTSRVWPGGNLPPVATPAVSWVDPTLGEFLVTFAASATAALATGVYRAQFLVTSGGRTAPLFDGRVAVTQTPGSASAALAFTTELDLIRYAPWLEDLQSDADSAGFTEAQARATNRLIDTLVPMWRQGGSYAPTMGQPGFGPFSLYGGNGAPPSKYLRDMLTPLTPGSSVPAGMTDSRGTYGTPPNWVRPSLSTALYLREGVVEVCARWACTYVFKAQAGRDSNRDWWAMARQFSSEARSLFQSTTFEIDLSSSPTGWASVTIRGGEGSMQ